MAATGWSPRPPVHPLCAWLWLAKECWLWFPLRGLDSSRLTQDSLERGQHAAPPFRYLGCMDVCSCDSIWETCQLWAWGEIFPLRRRGSVHRPSVWPLVPWADPVLANQVLLQASTHLCKHLPDAGSGSQREWKIAVIWPANKNVQNCHPWQLGCRGTNKYLITAARKWSKYALACQTF